MFVLNVRYWSKCDSCSFETWSGSGITTERVLFRPTLRSGECFGAEAGAALEVVIRER